MSESATVLYERGISFSPSAQKEMAAITGAVGEALDKSLACYTTRSRAIALQVEPIEEVVDLMRDELKSRHIERLKSGACTVELGSQFLELLINLERISDHCSNVAIHILQQTAPKDALVRTDSHAYMKALHRGDDKEFEELYNEYREKYYSPIERFEP